jgi:hypothetical protein
LLGRLALKFRRHFPQSTSDPEVKGGSGHGNKNFCLLPQVCTANHWSLFGNGALFQVNDISLTSFQISVHALIIDLARLAAIAHSRLWHLLPSKSAGMSAAGESGLCIVTARREGQRIAALDA